MKLNEEKADKIAQKKAQEFDNLLSGKKSNDDKNLQQIFSDFYNRATSTTPSEGILNSAKNSIGSLGSKLEERRKNFTKSKQTE